jgi:hypothetical protein
VSLRVNFVVRTVLGLRKTFPGGRAARPPRSDSGASVQGVILSQGDRVFDESKIFVEQCLGLRAGRARRSAIHRIIASSTAMKARAILAAYWVKVIGVARLDEFRDCDWA